MASFETCTYHTVTLQPGEQFNLPPGAVIVSVTDPGAITSINNCANLDNVETILCFGTTFGDANEGSGGQTPVYNDVNIYGVTVNGINYPFSSSVLTTGSSPAAILAALNETSFGALFSDCDTSLSSDSNRGNVLYVSFKTIPSIVQDFFFYGIGTGQVSGTPSSSVPIAFRVIPYDELISQGGETPYPVCALT